MSVRWSAAPPRSLLEVVGKGALVAGGAAECAMLLQVMATLWWVGLCYGFVLLSAAAGDGDLWPSGAGHHYDVLTTVLLNEPGAARGKDVGFQVTASLSVGVVWSSGADERLLRLEVRAPAACRSRCGDVTPPLTVQMPTRFE